MKIEMKQNQNCLCTCSSSRPLQAVVQKVLLHVLVLPMQHPGSCLQNKVRTLVRALSLCPFSFFSGSGVAQGPAGFPRYVHVPHVPTSPVLEVLQVRRQPQH